MSRAAFVVMAKAPAEQGVKTRLSPVLEPGERRDLARALLEDRVDQLGRLADADAFVAFTPERAESALKGMLEERASLLAQGGGDLGARLERASAALFARGYERVLLVDADSALVPDATLEEAARALAAVDVVLGPSWDGGYYLIGLRAPRPALFVDIPFSTEAVLATTLARAEEAGLTVHLLASSYDVDEPQDLARLAGDLRRRSPYARDLPQRTLRLLAALCPPEAEAPEAASPWSTLSRRDVYANRWIRVNERVVKLESGGATLYGVVHAGPCVGVLPRLADGRVLLVRQYRYVAGRHTWEIPTGGCRPGEALLDAAARELEEETGHRAERFVPLGSYHTSKSILEEEAHLFVAEDARPRAARRARPDLTESIEVRPVAFEELLAMIDAGEIVDSMTIIAAYRLARR